MKINVDFQGANRVLVGCVQSLYGETGENKPKAILNQPEDKNNTSDSHAIRQCVSNYKSTVESALIQQLKRLKEIEK